MNIQTPYNNKRYVIKYLRILNVQKNVYFCAIILFEITILESSTNEINLEMHAWSMEMKVEGFVKKQISIGYFERNFVWFRLNKFHSVYFK